MWKELLAGFKEVEQATKYSANAILHQPTMGMNFLRKGISFGSMVYKAERAEMKKMQEFDKRVMVLQPYYDIINNFFAEITK